MLTGGALGLAVGVGVSALMYFGLLAIPAHKLFKVTSGLITFLAAGLAAQSMGFLQQAGLFQSFAEPLWDTSAILSQTNSVAGRILHTLVGYMDQPNLAQVVVYLAVFVGMIVLMRVVHHGPKPAAR